MDVILLFIRLPFFLAGLFLLAALGVVVACMAIGLAPLVLALAAAVWLLLLLPFKLIHAAFTNRPDLLNAFFKQTADYVTDVCKRDVAGAVRDYLRSYEKLSGWLMGAIEFRPNNLPDPSRRCPSPSHAGHTPRRLDTNVRLPRSHGLL